MNLFVKSDGLVSLEVAVMLFGGSRSAVEDAKWVKVGVFLW